MIANGMVQAEGRVRIVDDHGSVILDVENAVHPENLSVAIAKALAGDPEGHVHEMHFGNRGAVVSGAGAIQYLPPNVNGADADLYGPVYFKVVDPSSSLNPDPLENRTEVYHAVGELYSDLVVKCALDYDEPAGQQPFDNAEDFTSEFVFNELGLKTYSPTLGNGLLLTHAIFSPVQKAANRRFEISYTLRIRLSSSY